MMPFAILSAPLRLFRQATPLALPKKVAWGSHIHSAKLQLAVKAIFAIIHLFAGPGPPGLVLRNLRGGNPSPNVEWSFRAFCFCANVAQRSFVPLCRTVTLALDVVVVLLRLSDKI